MSRPPAGKKTGTPSAPTQATLEDLRVAAASCQACDLWRKATQTVFGSGPSGAGLMLVGEQPGDFEDLQGEPFVGPAGKLLDRALEAAGLRRKDVYVTNVVKHFKWIPRGKRRLHEKPNPREIAACRPWLEAEIANLKPRVIVCLGATAAQTLLGRTFRVLRQRGQWIESVLAPHVIATVHPSSILRTPTEEARHAEEERFIADIRKAASVL